MLRILIVDDERIILNGIRTMIENDMNLPFPTDIVTASNAPQALEFLKHFTPDLILTDIRMPVIDGFELICQIRKQFPSINIVILTSHADFEYAQKAIRFQVADFILKPVSSQKLKETVERAHSQKQEKEEAALRDALIELRNMMLYDISPQELISTPEQIQQLFPHPYFTVIALAFSQMEDTYSAMLENILLQYYNSCKCFSLQEQNQLIAICNHTQFFVKPHELEQEFYHASRCEVFWIGISISSDSYKSLHNLYVNASQRIFYARHFGESIEMIEISLFSYQDCVRIFMESSSENVLQLLEEYLRSIQAASPGDYTPQTIYASFFHNILLYMEHNSIPVPAALAPCHARNNQELILEIMAQLNFVKKSIPLDNDCYGSDSVIRQLLEYIQQHYREDVSLEDLAACVGMHPNYVCTVFKKSLGQSYLSYLHRERLNAAKKLLLDTDYTIEQIAAEVGYSSASQLARIFRKYESKSPSDFRNFHNVRT